MVDEEQALESAGAQPSALPEVNTKEQSTPPPPIPEKRSRSGAWIGYVILVAIVGLAVGGWFLLQELRSKQEGLGGQITSKDQQLLEVTRQLSALQQEMAALHSQLATVQSQVTTEDVKFEKRLTEGTGQLSERLDAAKSELSGKVDHIQRQLNKSRGDLMVADAEYLLSIANQKLHLVGDVKSVLAAMEAADQRLHDSGDPAVFKVRTALAEEIAILKKLEAPDVVGISAKLLALEKRVGEIPLFLPHAPMGEKQPEKPAVGPVQPPKAEGEGEEQDGGSDIFGSTLKDIEQLVKVRRTDRPVAAVLTPEETVGLREILLLKLEMTRSALLRSDEKLYKESLGSALDWLKQNFDTEVAETKEMQTELYALMQQSISVPFPDISQSLSLLRNIEKLRLEAEEAEAQKNKQTVPEKQEPATGAQP